MVDSTIETMAASGNRARQFILILLGIGILTSIGLTLHMTTYNSFSTGRLVKGTGKEFQRPFVPIYPNCCAWSMAGFF